MKVNATMSKRRRRERLFRQNPFCLSCGVKMGSVSNKRNSVTLEHIVSRNQPLRGKIKGRTILLCKNCNEGKAAEEERNLPKVELWRRAGHLERMLMKKNHKQDT